MCPFFQFCIKTIIRITCSFLVYLETGSCPPISITTLFLIAEHLVFRWEYDHLGNILHSLAFLAAGQWKCHVHLLKSVLEGNMHALLPAVWHVDVMARAQHLSWTMRKKPRTDNNRETLDRRSPVPDAAECHCSLDCSPLHILRVGDKSCLSHFLWSFLLCITKSNANVSPGSMVLRASQYACAAFQNLML